MYSSTTAANTSAHTTTTTTMTIKILADKMKTHETQKKTRVAAKF